MIRRLSSDTRRKKKKKEEEEGEEEGHTFREVERVAEINMMDTVDFRNLRVH